MKRRIGYFGARAGLWIKAAVACGGFALGEPEFGVASLPSTHSEPHAWPRDSERNAGWHAVPDRHAVAGYSGQHVIGGDQADSDDSGTVLLVTAGLAAMTLAVALAIGSDIQSRRHRGSRPTRTIRHRGKRERADMTSDWNPGLNGMNTDENTGGYTDALRRGDRGSESPCSARPTLPTAGDAPSAEPISSAEVAIPPGSAAPAAPLEPSPPTPAVPPGELCRAISVMVVPPPAAVPSRSPDPQAAAKPRQSAVEAIACTRSAYSHQAWGSFDRDAVPNLLFYGGNRFRQFSVDALDAADEWFVIGDIHGDFYALHTIISHVRETCPGFGIIFLGDLIDRGPHPIECLWYLLKLADDLPGRVLWIAGNHDVGVGYDESAGVFRSTVQPAEFVSDLNVVDSFSPLRRAFGREYIELTRGLPRAAVMPDGLLLAHGGFPHTDLQGELARLPRGTARCRWLESDAVLRDFTHLRITRYPTRRPNRLSISCSYGYRDFDAFRRSLDGYGIRRLVTGHQHCRDGYDDHPEWAENGTEALTLTGFGFGDDHDRPESFGPGYRRTLVVGRCRTDRIPEVVKIPVNEEDLAAFHRTEIATMPRFAAARATPAAAVAGDRAVVGTA